MMTYKSFGDFLHAKRIQMKLSYRELAEYIDVTAPYLSDIEKGRRNAPVMEKLQKLSKLFGLSEKEEALMFDLAGKKKNDLPPDLPNYIIGNEEVVAALRTARDLGANEEDWQRFVDELKKRKG
jgi:transcriptional regulator with XRE-family HTH domain